MHIYGTNISLSVTYTPDILEMFIVHGIMYCISFMFSFPTYLLFGTLSLLTSLRLCVWRTVEQMARARMTARQPVRESERQKTTWWGSGKPFPEGEGHRSMR